MLKRLVAIELTVSLLLGIPTGVYAEIPENETFQSSGFVDGNENFDSQTELQNGGDNIEDFTSEETVEADNLFEVDNSDDNEGVDEAESEFESNSVASDNDYSIDDVGETSISQKEMLEDDNSFEINDIDDNVWTDEAESTFESDSTVSDYEYSIDGVSGTAKIKKYLGSDSVVEIPQQIDGYTVTSIGGFNENNTITKVVIPNGVKEIKSSCFQKCENLKEVDLPDSVESIEGWAFAGCKSLSSIRLSDKLQTINECTFYNTYGLREITIPDGVKRIEHGAFCGSGIEKIDLPENLEYIGYSAFDSTNLKEVVVPENVNIDEVGWDAGFNDCKQLERIEFRGNTYLPYDELWNCNNLKEIIFRKRENDIYSRYITSKATIYGLSNSTAYNFANVNGNSFYPIDPPQNRKAEKVDNTTIKLSWTSVSKNVSYKIYRSTSENNGYSLIATVGATEYIDYSLPEDTKYYYKICVCYEGIQGKEIEGVLSSSVEGDLTVPPRVTAKPMGYNTIKLTWKKMSGISGYYVYRKKSENGTYKRIATLKNVSSYIDKKAVGGNAYYYKVKAYKKSGSKKIAVNEGDVSRLVRAKRQPKLVSLKTGKTYTKYDVTGDGINDKFYAKWSYSGYNSILTFYINGKKSGTIRVYNDIDDTIFWGRYELKLCTLSSNTKNVFLSVKYEAGTNDIQLMHKLYKCTTRKMKKVLDVQKNLKIGAMQGSKVG